MQQQTINYKTQDVKITKINYNNYTVISCFVDEKNFETMNMYLYLSTITN